MTEIGLHVRRPEQIAFGNAKGLTGFGDRGAVGFSRIYIGDEFCPLRLPHGEGVRLFFRECREAGLGLTLLTPVMSDLQLERAMPIFSALFECAPEAEVVANDWGVFCFLKRSFPRFSLALGRLLDRGDKDPRHRETDAETDAESGAESGAEYSPMAWSGTFDGAGFVELMRRWNVRRLERDLPPWGRSTPAPVSDMGQAVYFPYGCFTAGRVCLTSSMSGSGRFAPADPCGRECEKGPIHLKHPKSELSLMANGNALYYRYSPTTLQRLMNAAEAGDFRLIDQGLSLGQEASFMPLKKADFGP